MTFKVTGFLSIGGLVNVDIVAQNEYGARVIAKNEHEIVNITKIELL